MIGRLTGRLAEIRDNSVLIDVGGVGYLVYLPARNLDKLRSSAGDDVSLYTHTYVREDALQLYGFCNREELRVFEMLLGVSRIGAKLALAVLDVFDADGFRSAINRGDVALLTEVSGVGKKTAERLILELQDKVDSLPLTVESSEVSETTDRSFSEAVEALEALGYPKTSATQAMRQVASDVDTEDSEPQELVRSALKILSEEGGS